MRFPVPHCAGTSGRHLGGPAGVCRGPRELPPALPWALPEICGALPTMVPWALCQLQPARFSCTQHLEGHPRCSCRCTGTRMHVAMVRSCRRCRAGVIFTPCQQGCVAPWPYYTGTSVPRAREALQFTQTSLRVLTLRLEAADG